MSRKRQLPLAWIALGLLATLASINVVLVALLQTGGPLIGVALYAVLLWRWQRHDYQAAVVGGLAGLAVHAVEMVITDWSAHPILMALNLILPAVLTPVAWTVDRRARQKQATSEVRR